MGCLNDGNYKHWFGNIHLSGPCNRRCYFCIGQHMMDLDKENNLNKWPLENIDEFIEKINALNIKEVNITGSNTDPSLYMHHFALTNYLRKTIPDIKIGIRTNGILLQKLQTVASLYDKASVSVTSFDPDLYKQTMGIGSPPNLEILSQLFPDLKLNIVLCPEVKWDDIFKTICLANIHGIKRINLRQPYGQPHIQNPILYDSVQSLTTRSYPRLLIAKENIYPYSNIYVYDNPVYYYEKNDIRTEVIYWDVHWTKVSSINLYASGKISEDYSVTKGCGPNGKVLDQSNFQHGRQIKQWNYTT